MNKGPIGCGIVDVLPEVEMFAVWKYGSRNDRFMAEISNKENGTI